ncbi:MAG: hypothetical protein IPH75_06865 [bacterium]|nr:hypothetical protein [bacterium]
MSRNPGAEKIKGESTGSLLRLAGLLTLGIALLSETLFFIIVSTCPVNLLDKTLLQYPDISGSIFVRNLSYYSPSCGCKGSHEFPFPFQDATVLCTIDNDTLVLCSYAPLDTGLTREQAEQMTTHEVSYFYKHLPFTGFFEKITALNGMYSIPYFLDYDQVSKRFVRWDPRDDKLQLLDRDFELVREMTPDLKIGDVNNSIWGLEFVKAGIAVQFTDTLRIYQLVGDSLIATDKVYRSTDLDAVSHSGELAIFSRRSEDEAIPYLLDIATGDVKKLHFKQKFRSACFSPNDSLIAYSRVTNNLTDDVTLFIYDLYSGRLRKTGVQNAVGIKAWVRSGPPVADSLVQSD